MTHFLLILALLAQDPAPGGSAAQAMGVLRSQENAAAKALAATDLVGEFWGAEARECLHEVLRAGTDLLGVEAVLDALAAGARTRIFVEDLLVLLGREGRIFDLALGHLRSAEGDIKADVLRMLAAQEGVDAGVRRGAIHAAGAMGWTGAVELLIGALGEPGLAVHARRALRRITGHVDTTPEAWDAWWASRSGLTRSALLEESVRRAQDLYVAAAKASLPGRLDRQLAALSEPFPELRAEAARWLAAEATDAGTGLAQVIAAMQAEEDPEVLGLLIRAVGLIGRGHGSGRDALLGMLEAVMGSLDSGPPALAAASPAGRAALAGQAAFELGARDPEAPVFAGLYDVAIRLDAEGRAAYGIEGPLRREVLGALVHAASEAAETRHQVHDLVLKWLSSDPDEQVRRRAAAEAGRVIDRDSLDSLAAVAGRAQDGVLRLALVKGLRIYAERLASQGPESRGDLGAVLRSVGSFLGDEDWQVRRQAAEVLGLGSSVAPLAARLASEEHVEVRQALLVSVRSAAAADDKSAQEGLGLLDLIAPRSEGPTEPGLVEAIAAANAGYRPGLAAAGDRLALQGHRRAAVDLLEAAVAAPGEGASDEVRVRAAELLLEPVLDAVHELALEPDRTLDADGAFPADVRTRFREDLARARLLVADSGSARLVFAEALIEFWAPAAGAQSGRTATDVMAGLEGIHLSGGPDKAQRVRRAEQDTVLVLIKAGRHAEALEIISVLAAAHPSDGYTLHLRAHAAQGLGRPAEAASNLKTVRRLLRAQTRHEGEFWRLTEEITDLYEVAGDWSAIQALLTEDEPDRCPDEARAARLAAAAQRAASHL